MFNKYLGDYYTFKASPKEICEIEDKATSTFNRWLKRNGLITRQQWLGAIDTGISELDKALSNRYLFMLKRCKYKRNDRYENYKTMEYMSIIDYVNFCHKNKGTVLRLWNDYTKNDRNQKYAISIDRVDNEKGYVDSNVEFVIHGFNSWKRSAFPINVEHKGTSNYFLTREDASLFYGLRRQSIGEIYNDKPYHIKGYKVSDSTIEEVLKQNGTKSLFEYYQNKRG